MQQNPSKEDNVKKNSLLLIALLVIAALVMAACAPAPTPAPATEEPMVEEATEVPPTEAPTEVPLGEPLKVGVIQSLTGGLALFGVDANNAFSIGLEYATDGTLVAGNRPIEIIVRDDTGVPEVGAQLARELIEAEGVEILVGASSSAVALQVMQIAAENDVVYLAGPAAAPAITADNYNDQTFRICRNAAQDGLVIMPWAFDNLGTRYMILAEDYAFGQQTAATFQAYITALGGELLPEGAPIFAPTGTADFTPYITQVLDNEPDALVLIWADNTSAVTLFEQLNNQGVTGNVPFVTGFSNNELTALLSPGFIGATGLIVYHYSLPDTPANDYLVEQNVAQFGAYPDLFSECGFATAQAMVAAINATAGDTSSEALIGALEGMSFEGPKGSYTIRAEDHQALAPGYVVELVSVDDPDELYFELVSERPADEIAPACTAPNCPK